MITLKLKNALSYYGIVSANAKQPFVTVESNAVADQAVKTGYFDVVEAGEQQKESGSVPSDIPEDAKHTKSDLKKLNKDQQEELITQLGGDPEETKNEEERITLILDLQERQEGQGE
ncbi:hypothetical protein [Siminovitchia terrae]|uniref:hypothetical protein n=1 Tax=Siminovitchia terrae TaxID=1914933 RepID=UPI0028AA8DD5|nr:hypothetical protein [Siminovitchia terrae]